MSDLRRELGRKAFHMLALVYWVGFLLAGWPRAGWYMAAWLVVVAIGETARLRIERFERFLSVFFGGMIREAERRNYSGIIFTTAGSLAAMVIARGDPAIVGAAIGQLAFGDAAAAIAGKAFGRTKILGGQKSLEGTLAGFAAGYAVAIACGVPPGASLASALCASAVELIPTTPWFNDNLWIPVTAASVLAFMR